MTDSARIHTWGCERHKEDTYEGCYSCDLEHSGEVSSKLLAANARIAELEKALREAKRNHSACDDPWYTCPMHPDGCADSSREKDECTCGAEDHNAKIDSVLMGRESQ